MLSLVIKDNTNNNYCNNLNHFIGDINNNKVGILREKLMIVLIFIEKLKFSKDKNIGNTYFSIYSHFHKISYLLLVTNAIDFWIIPTTTNYNMTFIEFGRK